jgi:hypothetical protein
LPTCYAPVRRVSGPKPTPLDLHALGTPPALILSQDQTLHQCARAAPQSPSGLLVCFTHVIKAGMLTLPSPRCLWLDKATSHQTSVPLAKARPPSCVARSVFGIQRLGIHSSVLRTSLPSALPACQRARPQTGTAMACQGGGLPSSDLALHPIPSGEALAIEPAELTVPHSPCQGRVGGGLSACL